MTYISELLGALRVEHLRAIGKAPSRQRRVNPMFQTEQLPARIFNVRSNRWVPGTEASLCLILGLSVTSSEDWLPARSQTVTAAELRVNGFRLISPP